MESTMSRWGKPYKDQRNWPEYNEQLVVRGEFYPDLGFSKNWNSDLRKMNGSRRGGQFEFPDSLIKWLVIWKQLVDYRGLEGITRKLHEYGLIPDYPDYTTIWHRIHDLVPEIRMPDYSDLDPGSDGTGLKTSNAGEYRVLKYGDPDAGRRKHLVVVITAGVKTKKIIGIEVYIEGKDHSEPDAARKHIGEVIGKGYSVREFFGDGAFDTNDMFSFPGVRGIKPIIKIRKNASTDRCRGSRYRRKEIREYQEKGYRKRADDNDYGMRWPGTEGIISAVKRKFGENTVSRSEEGLLAEGFQRFWAYDEIREYGERRAGMEVKVQD